MSGGERWPGEQGALSTNANSLPSGGCVSCRPAGRNGARAGGCFPSEREELRALLNISAFFLAQVTVICCHN